MSLRDHILRRIKATGPISVADYMAECLLHPTMGYYQSRDPFGAQGDFITAPEISQMFGELIGLCLAQTWIDQGQPQGCVLAELGPGRGTLMADILRATRGVPGFHDAMRVCLVEASAPLRARQAETLQSYAPEWFDTVADLPKGPLFVIANEFFDALPIRQFIRTKEGWSERLIGGTDALGFGLGTPTPQPALQYRLEDTQDGDLVEICEPAAPILRDLALRIGQHGGAGLIIDYGDWRSLGDTLQALKAHDPVDPLLTPGEADLTAHVDFESLTMACADTGCAFTRVTPQGVFLERLGITPRAQALASRLTGKPLTDLQSAHRRLTHPEEMGNLFKVLGLFPAPKDPPPGLER
jgi:SAM-dependent MidA family methyltransferase